MFSFYDTTRFILYEPQVMFRLLRDESLRDSYIHYLKCLVLFVCLITAIVYTGLDFGEIPRYSSLTHHVTPFQYFGILFGAGMIMPFLWGMYLHGWVVALGGRTGFTATLKAQLYADTPLMVFGWIPYLGLLGILWYIVTQGIAIQEFHALSTERSAIVVIGSLAVPLILLFSYAALFHP